MDRLADQARLWFPTRPEIGAAIARRQGGHPVACYAAALEKLRVYDPPKQEVAYFLGTVKSMAANGLPSASPTRPSGPEAVYHPMPVHKRIFLSGSERERALARIEADKAARKGAIYAATSFQP